MSPNDSMPNPFTLEYKKLKERAMKLSHDEVCDLLKLAGISFASTKNPNKPAARDELLDIPKDMLLEPLDEAKSRVEVERFLTSKGV